MTKIEFNGQMARVISTFDERHYSEDRLDIIWRMVESLEFFEFRKVVDHLINTFRQAPLPKDFFEASAGYRKNRLGVDDTSADPDCAECLDTGFFRVRYHDDQDSATLMRCNCPMGAARYADLFIPAWEKQMSAVFKRAPCPMEWFLPGENRPSGKGDGKFEDRRLQPLIDQFRARLRTAELHWKSLQAKNAKQLGGA